MKLRSEAVGESHRDVSVVLSILVKHGRVSLDGTVRDSCIVKVYGAIIVADVDVNEVGANIDLACSRVETRRHKASGGRERDVSMVACARTPETLLATAWHKRGLSIGGAVGIVDVSTFWETDIRAR